MKTTRLLTLMVFTLATIILSCATVPAVPRDNPATPDQCFEGNFNPFRLSTEPWEAVAGNGNTVVVQNPTPNQYPKFVIVQINQWGQILSYLYLDGKDLVAFGTDGKCYRKMELEPNAADKLKLFLLNLSKERHCELNANG